MSHPDVRLVNILLSTTRVSLVQNKFVFCQLRVHYSIRSAFSVSLHEGPHNAMVAKTMSERINDSYVSLILRML